VSPSSSEEEEEEEEEEFSSGTTTGVKEEEEECRDSSKVEGGGLRFRTERLRSTQSYWFNGGGGGGGGGCWSDVAGPSSPSVVVRLPWVVVVVDGAISARRCLRPNSPRGRVVTALDSVVLGRRRARRRCGRFCRLFFFTVSHIDRDRWIISSFFSAAATGKVVVSIVLLT